MEVKYYITVDVPESNNIESFHEIVETLEAEIKGIINFYDCKITDLEIK